MDTTTKQLSLLIEPLYLVGGSVRDEIIGRATLDKDYATPLLPDEVCQILKNHGIKPNIIGKRFGTILCKIDKYDIQITTFRGEDYPEESRKPKVHYVTDLVEDLKRRDFTINSLAKKDNKVIDPFNGKKDILDKCIKAVGKPEERFTEDPLRMIRAYRFVSELGFTVEINTRNAIESESSKILLVSKERLSIELDKIMVGDYFIDALESLRVSNIFKLLLPELFLANIASKRTMSNLVYEVNISEEDKLAYRWNYAFDLFLTDTDNIVDEYFKHEIIGHIAKYYKWSKDKTQLIQNYDRKNAANAVI